MARPAKGENSEGYCPVCIVKTTVDSLRMGCVPKKIGHCSRSGAQFKFGFVSAQPSVDDTDLFAESEPPAIGRGPHLPLGISSETMCGVQRPMRIAQRLATDCHQVGLAVGNNAFCLRAINNGPNGHSGYLDRSANGFGVWHLVPFPNRLSLLDVIHPGILSPNSAGGAINEVDPSRGQFAG